MKIELAKSGLSEEEILQKTMTVMKAFGRGDETDADASLVELSLASRQKNSALKEANISPKDFAKVRKEAADRPWDASVFTANWAGGLRGGRQKGGRRSFVNSLGKLERYRREEEEGEGGAER